MHVHLKMNFNNFEDSIYIFNVAPSSSQNFDFMNKYLFIKSKHSHQPQLPFVFGAN